MADRDREMPYYTVTPSGDGLLHVRFNAQEIDFDSKGPFNELAERLAAVSGPKRVILNLGNVRAINSAAIAMLIQLQKKLRDVDGRLKLCQVDPYVKNILSMTKVDQLMELHDTEQDAADAYHGKKTSAPRRDGGGWISKIFGKK
ncbi:MAG: STAS domain-containing protein [Isosphaeraceae bacterium]